MKIINTLKKYREVKQSSRSEFPSKHLLTYQHQLKTSRIKDGANQPLLRCVTHSTPMGCRGGDLNSYLAHATIIDGQPMNNNSVFILSRQVRYYSTSPERWKAWLARAGNPNQEPGIRCRRHPAPPSIIVDKGGPLNTPSTVIQCR